MPPHTARVVRACKRPASSPQVSHSHSDSRIGELLEEESNSRRCNAQVAFETSAQPYQLSLWRDRVAQWCYDIVDHLNAPRDTVYLAMNFLDRSVAFAIMDGTMTKEEYELSSITCLFLAIRVSTKADLKISDLLQICQSRLQVKDVQTTGSRLIHKLSLKTPMISPSTFARCYLKLLQSSVSPDIVVSLLEMACYLVELSVCDHFFAFVPPSKLAFAAVCICVTSEQGGLQLNPTTSQSFKQELEQHTRLSLESSEIKPLFERLRDIYKQSSDCTDTVSPNLIVDDSDHPVEPCSLESTESLIGLLPWTPSVSNLSGLVKRPEKRARLL